MKWSLRKAISCYAFASLQSPYMVTAYALVSQRAALLYLGIYLLIYVQQHNRNLKTSWRESVVDSLTLVLFWICHVLDHYSLAGEGETKIWRIGISRVFISDEGDLLCKLTEFAEGKYFEAPSNGTTANTGNLQSRLNFWCSANLSTIFCLDRASRTVGRL